MGEKVLRQQNRATTACYVGLVSEQLSRRLQENEVEVRRVADRGQEFVAQLGRTAIPEGRSTSGRPTASQTSRLLTRLATGAHASWICATRYGKVVYVALMTKTHYHIRQCTYIQTRSGLFGHGCP